MPLAAAFGDACMTYAEELRRFVAFSESGWRPGSPLEERGDPDDVLDAVANSAEGRP